MGLAVGCQAAWKFGMGGKGHTGAKWNGVGFSNVVAFPVSD